MQGRAGADFHHLVALLQEWTQPVSYSLLHPQREASCAAPFMKEPGAAPGAVEVTRQQPSPPAGCSGTWLFSTSLSTAPLWLKTSLFTAARSFPASLCVCR